jgi:hypothetical protein
MGLGFVVASGRWELVVVLVILLVGVFFPVMMNEAQKLAQRFPQDYADYSSEVPFFVPRFQRREEWFNERRFSWMFVRRNREHVTVAGWLGVVTLLGVKMIWNSRILEFVGS